MTNTSPDPQALLQSPLIGAYLNQLEYALRNADAGERDEILSTVHEHIVTALQEKPEPITSQDIEAILAGLGSVEQLAAGLARDPSAVHTPWAAAVSDAKPRHWPPWYGTALLVIGALSIPLIVFQPPLAILLALLALTLGVAGSAVHEKPHKSFYRWAAALGAFTVTMVIVTLLGLLGASQSADTPIVETVETSVAPRS